jgi:hypothetical protein
MTQDRCACGYQAQDPDDLAIHFSEMFVPDNDTAHDGKVHNEAAQDNPRNNQPPAARILTCRCGFTGPADNFDNHLLTVFTPPDHIGLDGNRHV